MLCEPIHKLIGTIHCPSTNKLDNITTQEIHQMYQFISTYNGKTYNKSMFGFHRNNKIFFLPYPGVNN